AGTEREPVKPRSACQRRNAPELTGKGSTILEAASGSMLHLAFRPITIRLAQGKAFVNVLEGICSRIKATRRRNHSPDYRPTLVKWTRTDPIERIGGLSRMACNWTDTTALTT